MCCVIVTQGHTYISVPHYLKYGNDIAMTYVWNADVCVLFLLK